MGINGISGIRVCGINEINRLKIRGQKNLKGSTGSELAKKTFERLNGINEINGIRVSEKTFARIRDQRDQS